MLDRLVRGRLWLGIVAVALLGIVFMQVSLLRLNASVGVAVTKADTLERENSGLRGDISKLDSGERIQDVAAKLGMVMPPAGDVRFLDARGANAGARVDASITAPEPVKRPGDRRRDDGGARGPRRPPRPAGARRPPAPAPAPRRPRRPRPPVTQQRAGDPAAPTPTPARPDARAATAPPRPRPTAGADAAPTGAARSPWR